MIWLLLFAVGCLAVGAVCWLLLTIWLLLLLFNVWHDLAGAVAVGCWLLLCLLLYLLFGNLLLAVAVAFDCCCSICCCCLLFGCVAVAVG
jgi:hypothetical protein